MHYERVLHILVLCSVSVLSVPKKVNKNSFTKSSCTAGIRPCHPQLNLSENPGTNLVNS